MASRTHSYIFLYTLVGIYPPHIHSLSIIPRPIDHQSNRFDRKTSMGPTLRASRTEPYPTGLQKQRHQSHVRSQGRNDEIIQVDRSELQGRRRKLGV